MDRATLIELLARIEEHIVMGAHEIKRQRSLLSELERDGRDTTFVRQLLRQFEQLQLQDIATRERLRKELAEARE